MPMNAEPQMILAPEPGIYEDVPFETYCRWDAVNNSSLGPLLQSPAHYQAARAIRKDTDAFKLGRLVHLTSLEPEQLLSHYVVEPDLTSGICRADGSPYASPRSTKAYKAKYSEWAAGVGDKEIVSQDWVDRSLAVLSSLRNHEPARQWLQGSGRRETSIVWDEPTTGLRCKSRLDMLLDLGLIPDLKTTRDVCDFSRSIGKFGYFRQAAFYADAAEAATGRRHEFAFIAVESEAPFSVRAALLDDDSLCAGRSQYRRLLSQLKDCRESGEWPGPANPERWRAPSWATDDGEEINLTVGGNTLTL